MYPDQTAPLVFSAAGFIKENYCIISKLPDGGGGSNIFHWGRGFNCLFPIVTHIACDFPGGRVRTFCHPPDPCMGSVAIRH